MKRLLPWLLTVALGLSLSANLLLLTSAPQEAFSSAPPPAVPSPAVEALPAPGPASLTAAEWDQAAQAHPEALASLRQLGLPPDLARALLHDLIRTRLRAQMKALKPRETRYWLSTFNRPLPDPEARRQRMALQQQQRALLRQVDAAFPEEESDPASVRHAYLPTDKRRQVQYVLEDYADLRMENQSEGLTTPEDKARNALLAEQERADLVALLTPEELRAYDLRNSPLTSQLRHRLSEVTLSEQEYVALYDLLSARGTTNDHASVSKLLMQDRTAFEDDLARVIGTERMAEYRIAQDSDFKLAQNLSQSLHLPAETPKKVYAALQTLKTEGRKLTSGSGTASPEEREVLRTQLLQSARKELVPILGEEGFKLFSASSPVLRELTRKRPATAKPQD